MPIYTRLLAIIALASFFLLLFGILALATASLALDTGASIS